LDDRLRRYLRQQAELGGSEVILGAPAERRAATPPPREAEPAPERHPRQSPVAAAPVVPAESPVFATPAAPSEDSGMPRKTSEGAKWRKDAPAIPGPGLVIEPPALALLDDGIGKLPTLEAIAGKVRVCTRCRLAETRCHAVPGEGNPKAELMCVGEGPGATEDETGRPFVGAAGKLLDQILAAIEQPRETVFIANIVKCRPPQNRKPLPDEAAACLPYLHRQISLVRPKVLLALGGTAAEHLLGVKKSLGELRGKVHRYGDIPLVVTYHPAALLRNPHWKKPTWDDVRVARQLLDQ
jgi:uracil-DNA glycosylase family 4